MALLSRAIVKWPFPPSRHLRAWPRSTNALVLTFPDEALNFRRSTKSIDPNEI
jgi:hypothetical protein